MEEGEESESEGVTEGEGVSEWRRAKRVRVRE